MSRKLVPQAWRNQEAGAKSAALRRAIAWAVTWRLELDPRDVAQATYNIAAEQAELDGTAEATLEFWETYANKTRHTAKALISRGRRPTSNTKWPYVRTETEVEHSRRIRDLDKGYRPRIVAGAEWLAEHRENDAQQERLPGID